MHVEDVRPPNEKTQAYHFCITYNGCDFCLLTPSAIRAFPKCLLKGCSLKFRSFICLRSCSRHCDCNLSALHKDEHKKDAKHKKLLNLLCIVYYYNWLNCFITGPHCLLTLVIKAPRKKMHLKMSSAEVVCYK